MLRWLVRSTVAGSANSEVKSESNRASRKANEVIRFYKKVDSTLLNLYIYKPLDFSPSKIYNCVVFFHGGGWNNGSPKMFKRQSMYFASRGMIAISVEYRLKNTHGTTPFQATEDAKSSIRYIRKYANELNINLTSLVQKIIDGLYDGISTPEIDELFKTSYSIIKVLT